MNIVTRGVDKRNSWTKLRGKRTKPTTARLLRSNGPKLGRGERTRTFGAADGDGSLERTNSGFIATPLIEKWIVLNSTQTAEIIAIVPLMNITPQGRLKRQVF
jgi:hypothetical protein